ncbi:MAG: bifunctional oligoribonuclease/PAP phosphatase NrnA [Clostridia bacterium]|nr:bifunctional oligoribonuclease/PAP phosphatase NrnA [Clostridia bacterium]NCC44291.1 bifunctional oligoribonuclease/PAP phosphatase NrnA [Clostridia bacterium]
MNNITSVLEDVKTVAIAGHIRPDGDCVGSCMGMYLYLKDNYPQLTVDVYLEDYMEVFSYIRDLDMSKREYTKEEPYDLLLLFDVSSRDRIGVAGAALDTAKQTVCVDHHVTNNGLADINHICPDASSTCEVLYELLDSEKISKETAEALYTGIIHDTGVFQYSCTSARTMQIAGQLMEKKIDFTKIIKDSFYTKTYVQNQIMGRTIMESIMLLDGKCIVGYVRQRDLRFYGVEPKDLDGIVNQLQNTQGVEVAIFLYETGTQEYKVSMRSGGIVDVARIATYFSGGGHVRAAGCTMQGSVFDVINSITYGIEIQLKEHENGN